MKVGVMIVGVRGATASTLVATAKDPRSGDPERFLLSEQLSRAGLPMVPVDEIAWGGWDVMEESWEETFARHGVLEPTLERITMMEDVPTYSAALFEVDHASVVERVPPDTGSPTQVIDRLRKNIQDFVARTGVTQVILLHLGAPAILPQADSWPEEPEELLERVSKGALATAPLLYTIAAILEGAAVIDYTASATLEIPAILRLAAREGVPLAGRDGSTGQTLLKSVLAETFATRKLFVRGWYSTNILGNHDGFVLADERFSDVKREDKTALLEPILGHPVESHLVDIRYYRPAGDEKEAWDAIDFETWQGGRGQLRINWRACDSFLATPTLIDLVRLVHLSQVRGEAGLLVHLGAFFKHPLGTEERRYLRLMDELKRHVQA